MEIENLSRKRLRSSSPPRSHPSTTLSSNLVNRAIKVRRTMLPADPGVVVVTLNTACFKIPLKFMLDEQNIQILFQIMSDFLEDKKSHRSYRKTLKFERKRMKQLMAVEVLMDRWKEIPCTIEKVIKQLKQDINVIKNVSCIVCFALQDLVKPRKSVILDGVLNCKKLRMPSKTSKDPRIACNAPLYTTPSGANAKQKSAPVAVFHHQRLVEWIARMLHFPGFEAALDLHLSQSPHAQGVYSDVLDGNLWKKFQDVDGHIFTR